MFMIRLIATGAIVTTTIFSAQATQWQRENPAPNDASPGNTSFAYPTLGSGSFQAAAFSAKNLTGPSNFKGDFPVPGSRNI